MEEAIRFLLEAKLNGGDQALDQSQLRQSITAQLLDLRSQLSSLLFENHEAAKSLKNGVHARLREAHNEHADLSRLLHSLTVKRDQKASFTFSKGARAILEERGLLEPSASQQQQQQQQHRTAEDREVHGQKLLALQQEKEERLTLMRQMNALENEKQAQQRKIKELNRYLGGLPALVDKLSKHLEPMTRAPFDVPPSAVPLPESFFNVLDPRLRRMFARLSAYREAYESEAMLNCLLQANHLKIEFMSGDGRRPYILLITCTAGGPITVELASGPSSRSRVNHQILQLLQEGDVSAQGAFRWLSVLSDGTPAQVVQVISALEARFRAQRYLLPQLEMLRKRRIPEMSSYSHLTPLLKSARSKLVKFEPVVVAPKDHRLGTRHFRAVIELKPLSMTASISIDARYPQVTPVISLQVLGVSPADLPEYAVAAMSASAVSGADAVATKLPFDPQFYALESQVNSQQVMQDNGIEPRYVLGYQVARLQLGFEIYATLNSDRMASASAKRQGKDRQIVG